MLNAIGKPECGVAKKMKERRKKNNEKKVKLGSGIFLISIIILIN